MDYHLASQVLFIPSLLIQLHVHVSVSASVCVCVCASHSWGSAGPSQKMRSSFLLLFLVGPEGFCVSNSPNATRSCLTSVREGNYVGIGKERKKRERERGMWKKNENVSCQYFVFICIFRLVDLIVWLFPSKSTLFANLKLLRFSLYFTCIWVSASGIFYIVASAFMFPLSCSHVALAVGVGHASIRACTLKRIRKKYRGNAITRSAGASRR